MSTQAQPVNTQDFNGGPPVAPAPSIIEKTVCISLRIGTLGNSRKVNTSQIEVEADKALIRVSKKLLDSKQLQAVNQFDGQVRAQVKNYSLPSFFRAGIDLVPIPAIQPIEKILQEAKITRLHLIENFLAVYADEKAKAEERLRDLFNPADYPTEDAIKSTFHFEWQWISFATPAKLKEISAGFFAQEQQKAEQHWAQATEEVRLLLRAQLKDMVDHLADVITPDDGGKPKRFQATTVTKITDFLDTFAIKNVTDDAQLQQIVGHCKAILNGVDAETIRKQDNIREYVGKGMGLIKQSLDLLVEDAGTRRITLEDE